MLKYNTGSEKEKRLTRGDNRRFNMLDVIVQQNQEDAEETELSISDY